MRFDEFFRMIHRLSKKQRANFSRFTASQKHTLPNRLYKRFVKQKDLNETTRKKIEGDEFSNDSVFQFNKSILMNRIRNSISHYEYGDTGFTKQILAAIQLGDKEWASKTLFGKIIKCYQNGYYPRAKYLWDFAQELSIFHRFEIDTRILQSLLELDDGSRIELKTFLENMRNDLDIYMSLISALQFLKTAINGSQEDRRQAAIKYQLDDTSTFDSEVNSCLAMMVKVRIHYIENEIQQAIEVGTKVLDTMLSNPHRYAPSMVSAELQLVTLLAIRIKERDLAIEIYLKYLRLQIKNPQEEIWIQGSQTFVGSFIGAVFAESSIAIECLKRARTIEQFPNQGMAIITFYNLGITFFYNNEFELAIDCMKTTRESNRFDFNRLQWEPQIVLAICHFTMGNINEGDSYLRSARHFASKSKCKYPSLSVKLVSKRFQSLNNNQITAEDLLAVQELLLSPDEMRSSRDFHLDTWIKSNIFMRTQREIISLSNLENLTGDEFSLKNYQFT